MKFLGLYNWRNETNLVCLQAENFDEIDFINVIILSGDEALQVIYKNRNVESFDPEATNRTIDYYDGQYIIYGHEIEKWIDIGIEIEQQQDIDIDCYSYIRQEKFLEWQQERSEK